MTSVYDICFYGGLILSGVFLIAATVLFFVLKIPKVVGELTGSTARRKIREMKAHAESITLDKSVTRKEQAKYYNVGTGKITVKESTVQTPTKTKNKKKSGQTQNIVSTPQAPEQSRAQSQAQESAQTSWQSTAQSQAQHENYSNQQPLEDITEVLGAGRFEHTEDKTEVLSFDGDNSMVEDFDMAQEGGFDGDTATEVLSSFEGGADGYDDDSATEVLSSNMDMPVGDAASVAESEKKKKFEGPKIREGFTVLMDVMLIHTQDTI